jgi:hypothetical protein
MSEAVTLTKDDLKELLVAVIQETNKPKPPSNAEIAEIQQAQQMRRETADSVKLRKENEKFLQSQCTHEHSKQAGGGTHAVYVRDNDHPADAGFILCQFCQIRVRPESDKWRKLDPDATFDTALFNKLFQDCAQGSGEILG